MLMGVLTGIVLFKNSTVKCLIKMLEIIYYLQKNTTVNK